MNFSCLLLTPKEVAKFILILKGMEKTILKARNSRQKDVMAGSRRGFSHTLETLKKWRERRNKHACLDIFLEFEEDSDKILQIEHYRKMRDYLICEIVIVNAQRSGIIPGMTVKEFKNAVTLSEDAKFYLIMIANHKTGFLQSASVFLYPHVYEALKTFVHKVLPKLPIYDSNDTTLEESSPIFQDFRGGKISSSLVTPIVRRGLSEIGVNYRGTVTDFRRAAATLTGKYYPQLSEIMSQLMGHSRHTHDKVYRVQLGYTGLLSAFQALEVMQKDPFVNQNISNFSLRYTSLTNSPLSDSISFSSFDDKSSEYSLLNASTFSFKDHNLVDNIQTDNSIKPNDLMDTSHSIDLHVALMDTPSHSTSTDTLMIEGNDTNENDISFMDTDFSSECVISNNRRPLLKEVDCDSNSSIIAVRSGHDSLSRSPPFQSSPINVSSISFHQYSTEDIELGEFESFQNSTRAGFENSVSCEVGCLNVSKTIDFENVAQITHSPSTLSNFANLKECSVIVKPINLSSFKRRRCDINFDAGSCSLHDVPHKYKTIFSKKSDEIIFMEVYSDMIQRVTDNLKISKLEVIKRADSSRRFSTVLRSLKLKHKSNT